MPRRLLSGSQERFSRSTRIWPSCSPNRYRADRPCLWQLLAISSTLLADPHRSCGAFLAPGTWLRGSALLRLRGLLGSRGCLSGLLPTAVEQQDHPPHHPLPFTPTITHLLRKTETP